MATYKLYFYTTEKGSAVTPTSSVSMTFGSSSHKVTLSRMKYKKKVYEPCEILAELSIDGIAKNSEVVATFLNQKVDMEVEYETADKTKKSVTIATNYFVYKVKPIYSVGSTSSMTVELGIYSADKLMTLNKYSRAYTAKRLYTDILAIESGKFALKDNPKEEDCTKLNTLVANHMQMLKYKVTEKVTQDSETISTDVTYNDELLIPYIVQYNESFYQFMVRAANRFGEFLYFEDGKLNLGMQPSEACYYGEKDNADSIIDWAKESKAVQRLYYESVLSDGIKVEDLAYSYSDHTKKSKGSLYASTCSDNRYNYDAVPADEWVNSELEDGKYLTQRDLWKEELREHIVSFVCRCLGSSNLADFLVNLFFDVVKETVKVAEDTKDFNTVMTKDNYDPIKDDSDLVSSSGKYKQFATYNGNSHLSDTLKAILKNDKCSETNYTSTFYPIIRNKEKEIGEQAVWLDFGNNFTPVKLGDKLRVESTDYVVIQVEGSYDIVKKYVGIEKEIQNGVETYKPKTEDVVQEKLLVSAIPVLTLSSSSGKTKTLNALSGSDPWTSTLPLPPALPDVVIRDARPQVAFVVQTTDPECLGRIRVRYPWQNSVDDATPWIRVTLPYATSGGCVNFTPSEGDEVMVGYEYGNIDHPYAMGYLAAPFVNNDWHDSLPYDHWGATHGIKVKTGHHLIFNDGANAASFVADMFGITSMVKAVIPGRAWPDPQKGAADMSGGFEISDRYGIYKISGSTDERSITIESPMGTVDLNAFQGITISAPNGDVNITGKNVTISANNSLNITSGNTIKDRFYYQKMWSKGGWSKHGIANWLGAAGAAVGMDALLSLRTRIVDKVIDISFLRCLLEVLLRPVDGTLQIKSYTFIQMEAGPGVTEVPLESLRRTKGLDSQDDLASYQKLLNTITLVKTNVKALINPIQKAYDKLITAKESFMNISGDNGINKNQGAISFSDIVKYACGTEGETKLGANDQKFKFETAGVDLKDEETKYNPQSTKPSDPDELKQWEADKGKYDSNIKKKTKRDEIVAKAEDLRFAARNLYEEVRKWTGFTADKLNKGAFQDADIDKDDISGKIQSQDFFDKNLKKKSDLESGNYDEKISSINPNIWNNQIKGITRYVVSQYAKDKLVNNGFIVGKTLNDAESALVATNWTDFIQSIKEDNLSSFVRGLRTFGLKAKDYTIDKVVEEFRESPWKWKNGFEGKILFSDTKTKTISFDANQNLKTNLNQSVKESCVSNLLDLLIKL